MDTNTAADSSKRPKKYIKSLLYYLPIAGILILIDQLSKFWIQTHLKEHESIPIWPGVFEIYYLKNPFASFSFGKSFPTVFYTVIIIFSIIFILALIYLMLRVPPVKRYRFFQTVLILFFAGAVGNFIDRLRFRYVVDFFYFRLIDFPVFNVADIFVVFGAIFAIILFLFKGSQIEECFPSKKKQKKQEEEEEEKDTK